MTGLTMGDDVLASWPDLADAHELPSHTRISWWLEQLIGSQRLKPGDKLPAEVEMAAVLGVSRMTLRHALAEVEAKGLLQRRRGRFGGNFITQRRVDYHLAGLPGFTEQMRRAHVEAGALVVRASTRRPPEEVRLALGLRRGEHVHEVIRVRSANGEPVALEETYFPASVFGGMLEHDLTDSLYQVMQRHFGKGPYSAEELIEPVKATPLQAELLKIAVDAPLLLITRTSYAVDGVAVEQSYDYFRPDRTRIKVRTTVDGELVSQIGSRPATG